MLNLCDGNSCRFGNSLVHVHRLNTKTWAEGGNRPSSKQVADGSVPEGGLSESELPGFSGLADWAGGDPASSRRSSHALPLEPCAKLRDPFEILTGRQFLDPHPESAESRKKCQPFLPRGSPERCLSRIPDGLNEGTFNLCSLT